MAATATDAKKLKGLRVGCARALDRAAELIDEPAAEAEAPVIRPSPPSTAFAYDTDLPPDVPPGESLAAWHHEHAQRRREAAAPRNRMAARIRRLARRLDGRIIDTHTLPLG